MQPLQSTKSSTDFMQQVLCPLRHTFDQHLAIVLLKEKTRLFKQFDFPFLLTSALQEASTIPLDTTRPRTA